MIPTDNKPNDEIANRLTMAISILSNHMVATHYDSGADSHDIWGAQQLIQDALYLFEDKHFPGNKLLRNGD